MDSNVGLKRNEDKSQNARNKTYLEWGEIKCIIMKI